MNNKHIGLRTMAMIMMISLLVSIILACGNTNQTDSADDQTDETVSIVASTSWVAMMAKAAGAEHISILAPIELRHPPEYDFKPSDIDRVQTADFVLYAGYEPFMRNILESVTIAEEKIIQVRTENTPDNLKQQVREIAQILGTEEVAEQWVSDFEQLVAAIDEEAIRLDTASQKAVVQMHMVPMARYFGYDVVAEFAEDLSPVKTAELAELKPDIIIDNYHNSQGKGIEEIAQVPRVELRNFPGEEHPSIEALLKDNAQKLGFEL